MKKIYLLGITLVLAAVSYSQSVSCNIEFKNLLASTGKVDAYVNIEKQSDGYFWTYLKLVNTDTTIQSCRVYISLIYWKIVNKKLTQKQEYFDLIYDLRRKEIKLTTLPWLSMTNRTIIRDVRVTMGD